MARLLLVFIGAGKKAGDSGNFLVGGTENRNHRQRLGPKQIEGEIPGREAGFGDVYGQAGE